MRTDSKLLRTITFVYIYMPIIIFLLGYTKIWVSFISIVVCGIFLKNMYLDYSKNEETQIIIDKRCLIVALVIISIFCILIGYGGVFEQAGDWSKHNAVLHDLVERSWPVFYTEHDLSMLTYYVGQYMVPALLGKLTLNIFGEYGFEVSSVTMAVWGIVGIVLVFVNLVRITNSNTVFKQLRCLFLMLFFSGVLPVVQIITRGIYGEDMYSLGHNHWLLYNGLMVQYRSNMVMLRWVFPQTLVVWLIIILFFENKDKTQYYVLLFLPVLIYGTFAIILLSIMAISCCVYLVITRENKKEELLKIFSLSNILCFVTLGTVFLSFFIGYLQVEKPSFMRLHFQLEDIYSIWGIIVFDLFMVGIYGVCILDEQNKNILFHVSMIFLCVLPAFSMGLYNDIVMGASIPGLFCLMIWVIQFLNKEENSKVYGYKAGIIMCCFLLGFWYQALEIKDNIKIFTEKEGSGIEDFYGSLAEYSDRGLEEHKDLMYNYFTYDLDGKIFYECFARKKIDDVIGK